MDLQRLKNKKVLIVEDDPVNSELIKEIFDGLEAIITGVISGDEAIKSVKADKPDIILMDIQLPGMSGYEATKAIKKFEPDIPIIAQTAYAFDSDRYESLKSGCVDYISKPFKKDELLKIILKNI